MPLVRSLRAKNSLEPGEHIMDAVGPLIGRDILAVALILTAAWKISHWPKYIASFGRLRPGFIRGLEIPARMGLVLSELACAGLLAAAPGLRGPSRWSSCSRRRYSRGRPALTAVAGPRPRPRLVIRAFPGRSWRVTGHCLPPVLRLPFRYGRLRPQALSFQLSHLLLSSRRSYSSCPR